MNSLAFSFACVLFDDVSLDRLKGLGRRGVATHVNHFERVFVSDEGNSPTEAVVERTDLIKRSVGWRVEDLIPSENALDVHFFDTDNNALLFARS